MTALERIRQARERREAQIKLWGEGPYYVNRYDVTRLYGGPEEGGWWFDHGTPTSDGGTIFESLSDALSYRDHHNDLEGTNNRFSVNGGSDTVYYIEAHSAKEWYSHPGEYEVPHYE